MNQLNIGIKIDEQDFVSRALANYQDSSAALFYRDEVRSQYGDRAFEAYEFGLKIESFFRMAVEDRFKYSMLDPGFWAEGALAELNEYAGKFDLEQTSIKLSEENMVGDSWVNLSIKMIVHDYDQKFEKKW